MHSDQMSRSTIQLRQDMINEISENLQHEKQNKKSDDTKKGDETIEVVREVKEE